MLNKREQLNKGMEWDKMCKKLKEISGKTPEEILKFCGQENRIPIDIMDIIFKLGIILNETDFTEIEQSQDFECCGNILGAVYTEGDDLNICYQKQSGEIKLKSQIEHRKRFTLAHELAHCCLDMNPDAQDYHLEFRTDQLQSDNKKEYNANVFAGQLLIPTKSLLSVYYRLEVPSLEFLANLFNVSKKVMIARLNYLKLPFFSDNE
ncbi:MAG: ImmA/IrrE family metallo-endopeptidase [Lachnospiraceae bacterium]|nr:ImmA/IrrE family metallo-endopeptidase [Lachnospiraceae bacterium]